MTALAFLVGIFCVAAGWHWKLMHRAWQDVRQVREQAEGRIPALKGLRSRHTSVAIVFAIIAVILIAAVLH